MKVQKRFSHSFGKSKSFTLAEEIILQLRKWVFNADLIDVASLFSIHFQRKQQCLIVFQTEKYPIELTRVIKCLSIITHRNQRNPLILCALRPTFCIPWSKYKLFRTRTSKRARMLRKNSIVNYSIDLCISGPYFQQNLESEFEKNLSGVNSQELEE